MKQWNNDSRRYYSPEDEVRILREHLVEGCPISEVRERNRIHPTQFYQWQKPSLNMEPPATKSLRRRDKNPKSSDKKPSDESLSP